MPRHGPPPPAVLAVLLAVLLQPTAPAPAPGPPACAGNVTVGVHWPLDTESIAHSSAPTAAACAALCCEQAPLCSHWVWTSREPPASPTSAPTPAAGCATNTSCCWLKAGAALYPTAPSKYDTIGVLPSPAPGNGSAAAVAARIAGPVPGVLGLDPRYVSVGLETWEYLFDPHALASPAVRAVGAALAPGVLRVGGISADLTEFRPGAGRGPPPPPPSMKDSSIPLNASTFDALVAFCRATNLSLIFDLNEVHGRSGCVGSLGDLHGECGPEAWNATPVVALLVHARSTGAFAPDGPLIAVELGNEMHAHLSPERQAADYNELRRIITDVVGANGPMLFGPSADTPSTGAAFLAGLEPGALDGYTFHSYPLGSSLPAKLANPESLRQSTNALNGYLANWRNATHRPRYMALTETNSAAATAANPGQATFANGFWYVASLGSAAAQGVHFHCRWKFWNPRVAYRPEALTQTFGFLDKALAQATPDLWVALLHTRLVASGRPLQLLVNDSRVLAWAHCHPAAAAPAGDGGVVVLYANPLALHVNLTVPSGGAASGQAGAEWFEYVLTPGNRSQATSSTARLNGVELLLGPGGAIPDLPPKHVVSPSAPSSAPTVQLPPVSYGFIVLPSLSVPGVC